MSELPTASNEAMPEEKDALPAALSDGQPAEENGNLVLARYAARAFLEYALSVVKDRALPDVFDGLKPVQRRILYAMERMRLMPPSSYVKCARVVGDVIGKYHPHGDQAAYDAMVRMAQDFSLRYPLVDGEGNFGSRDGDPAAAMRYTEARLSKISELLLSELNAEDVEFVPNYDGNFEEPRYLPARMPFVLLNGASGIAVGMATEIPTHNLTEVGAAIALLLKKPQATLDEVLAVLPAPDFPGGGQITSSPEEIKAIYETGRGILNVRARWHFEELQRSQWQLVVDELPPQASAEKVLSEIETITNPKPKAGKKALSPEQQQSKAALLALLGAVRNECDIKTRVRLVFEPKTSKVDREAFVSALLAQTSLQGTVPVNLVMLGLDGRPQQKPLLTILSEWIQARVATVQRRSQARLQHVNDRLHIIAGRRIAVDHIDRVVEIARFSEDAKADLMKEFSLSDDQAEDILNMPLRQLGNLVVKALEEENKKLTAERAELMSLVASEALQKNVIARETREAVKAYGDERRTLVQAAQKAVMETKVPQEDVTVVISRKGYVRVRSGHGHDAAVMSYKVGDGPEVSLECQSTDTLVAVGSSGRVYSMAVADLPSARGDGLPITSFIELEAGTDLVGYLVGTPKQQLVLANDAGFGLLCTVESLYARIRAGKAFMKLPEGARMLSPRLVGAKDKILACLSEKGRLLAFPLSDLRELAGGGKGVVLMGLDAGEKLLDVLPAGDAGIVVLGMGRTTARRKTLVKSDWQLFWGHRARKGKLMAVRFNAKSLSSLTDEADANSAGEEEKPDPLLL